MNQVEYDTFCRRMVSEHALRSTLSRRNGMERTYYEFHKARGGQRLRAKYRPL